MSGIAPQSWRIPCSDIGRHLMKICICGKNYTGILSHIESLPFQILDSPEHADAIVTYGGDGALLGAERDFPEIPKFPIRSNGDKRLCPEHSSYRHLFEMLLDGKLKTFKLRKIEGLSKSGLVKGINDVFLHNSNPVSAIRYMVRIDEEAYSEEIVGDGVGVSTVHGSTAYYKSITHSVFRVGLGLAFSNSTEPVNHMVLPEGSVVSIKITRGPSVMVADNSPDFMNIEPGEEVRVLLNDEYATIMGLDIFMCPKCRKLRHASG